MSEHVHQRSAGISPWRRGARRAPRVEVAFLSDAVAVRDSKDRGGPVHVFTSREWAAFVGGVLDGEFERS